MLNGSTFIRRELMIRIVRAFDDGTLENELDQIPIKLRPKNSVASRCCVYHDRAILKYRLMAMLGVSVEDETDESKSLAAYYAEKAWGGGAEHPESPHAPLSVCGPACSGCPDSKVVSTPNCRGCFARPCVYNCPKKAISIVGGQSVIDQSLCIKCGKCITACPYHAIVKTSVPCEEACPVGAIRKNEHGVAEIDFAKCIFCGKCFAACPFAAVMERSQLVDVLSAMKRGEKLVAMIAPAAEKQFPGKIEQLLSACAKAGFGDVMEVALGAERTTEHETAEFIERMEKDPKTFMTTSCCPAWVNLVGKHLPDLVDHVSLTPSPMVYAREIVKAKDPDAKTVFIGRGLRPLLRGAGRDPRRTQDRRHRLRAVAGGASRKPDGPQLREELRRDGRRFDGGDFEDPRIQARREADQRHRPKDVRDGEAVRRREDACQLPRGDGLSGRMPERALFARLTDKAPFT